MNQYLGQDNIVKRSRKNIVKVSSQDSKSFGTGFFIQKEYCVTCHHVIYKMNRITVEHENTTYSTEWIREYSDMEKDIAILRVKDCSAEPLLCSRQALPQLDVCGFGFLLDLIDNIPQGTQFNGKLQFEGDVAEFPAEDVVMPNKNHWNKKPKVSVDSYQLNCNIAGPGISGSPVFYTVNWMVVGMFMANPRKSMSMGYVIPIETILDKFKQEKEVAFASTTSTNNITPNLDEGNEHFRKEEYNIAIDYYDKVIRDPNLTFAWSNKGKSLGNLGKSQEAIECYNRALEIDPKYAFAWSNKGGSLADLQRMEEAIECYNRALEIDPKYAFAWSGKGWALIYIGKPEEAIKCFDKALELNPNYEHAWNGRGDALDKAGKDKEFVIYCYHRALQINPNDALTWNSKGYALAKLGNFDEAINCYNEALEINPNHTRAWNNKGWALRKLGKLEEAIKHYDKALQINPNDAMAWNNKGNALVDLGKPEEAIKCFDKALELNPDNKTIIDNKKLAVSKVDMGSRTRTG